MLKAPAVALLLGISPRKVYDIDPAATAAAMGVARAWLCGGGDGKSLWVETMTQHEVDAETAAKAAEEAHERRAAALGWR